MAKRKIGKENVTKKLMSFMKMFAEVKGMKHLYCYSTLQVIFISFLSNPDIYISKLSITCLLNFKLKHASLTPYAEHLNGIF